MALLRLLRRRQPPGHPLIVRWYGSAAVMSHPADSPLLLWQLLRDAAVPGDNVLIMASKRAMSDRAGGAALRGAVEHAARSWRTDRVWLAANGVGRPRGAHAAWLLRLAARSGVELLVPDGPVHATPDGTLYAAAGGSGWRSFRSGGAAPVAALRHPVPLWEQALSDRPVLLPGLVADPIPAGMLLHAADTSPTSPGDPAFHVPVDSTGPTLVLRYVGAPPVDPAHVAGLFTGLPERTMVHIETRLLDPSSAPPTAAWLNRLEAELNAVRARASVVDPFAPLPAGRRPVGEGPALIGGGWVRTGDRHYRHATETDLVAEVVPAGVMLRSAVARPADGSAFVEPEEGILTIEDAAPERLVDVLCRVLAGGAGDPGVLVVGHQDGAARLAKAMDPSSGSVSAAARSSVPIDVGPSAANRVDEEAPASGRNAAPPPSGHGVEAYGVAAYEERAAAAAAAFRQDAAVAGETAYSAGALPVRVTAGSDEPLASRAPTAVRALADPAVVPSVASVPAPRPASVATSLFGSGRRRAEETPRTTGAQATAQSELAATGPATWPALPAGVTVEEPDQPALPARNREERPETPRPTAMRPVITVSGPDLGGNEPERWRAADRSPDPPSGPVAGSSAVTSYRPATGEPVPERGSTADERRDFVAGLGPAYTDSITTVNAALAAWPALRQDASVAAKTDLVAVRLFFGRSGSSASRLNADLRAGRSPDLPGYLSCLVSGLRRLPPSRRAMLCQGRLTVPARQLYPEGAMLVEPAFRVVSGAGGLAIEGADVDYLIWSRTARQTGLLGDPELDEAVFLAGTRFKVLGVRESAAPAGDETAIPDAAVLLREVLPGEPPVPGLDDGDRIVLTRLERALNRRRSAAPQALDDSAAIDRLIGPPLGFVEATAGAG